MEWLIACTAMLRDYFLECNASISLESLGFYYAYFLEFMFCVTLASRYLVLDIAGASVVIHTHSIALSVHAQDDGGRKKERQECLGASTANRINAHFYSTR